MRIRRNDPSLFKKWMEYQIDRYTKQASYKWAKAVEKSYEFVEKYTYSS